MRPRRCRRRGISSTYAPAPKATATYGEVYRIWKDLHDTLGRDQPVWLHELKRLKLSAASGVGPRFYPDQASSHPTKPKPSDKAQPTDKGGHLIARQRPKIGLLGVMQELYDDMIPGITDHQANYASELAGSLSPVADVVFLRPARNRDDVEAITRELRNEGVDGIMIVMLTYGPAMRTVRALLENPLPVLVANVQPEREVKDRWTMDDLTYNQGIHGAQDQANALLRAGLPFSVITDDWRAGSFRTSFESWAKAAMTVTTLKSAKIALFGYPMNGMGDILYEAPALMRRIGPVVVNENLGELYAKMQDRESDAGDINSLDAAVHRQCFSVSADLPARQPCVRGASRNCLALHARGRRLLRFFSPLRTGGQRRPLPSAPPVGGVRLDGGRLRLRSRRRYQRHRLDVRRPHAHRGRPFF